MFLKIKHGLKQVDIFGQIITLKMNNSEHYTTSLGGFFSILIICLVSIIFYSNIIAFFQMQNVFHENEIIFSNDPQLIEMNSQNSMFAFSISQITNFTSNPFFNITFEQKIYSRQVNGQINKTTQEIPLKPCELSDFNNIFKKDGIDFTDQYYLLGINSMLCPLQNYTSQIQGTYSSEIFKFLRISVKDCQQNLNQINSLWNPTCANDSERNAYLLENGQFKLQIIQINTVINPQNPKNYKTVFIDSDMYFSFVPKKLARIANIFYRQFQMNNDESILPYENVQYENLILRKAEDFRDLTELGRDSDDNYAIVYMRRSPFTEIIKRKFQKLGELLSYLGGFMQIMRIVFGFIIAFYNKTAMLIELANKLYEFKDEQESRRPRQLNTVKYHGQKYQPDVFLMEQKASNTLINEVNELNNMEWKDCMNRLVQKSKPILFNFKLFINQLTNGWFMNDTNSQFLEKAIERMNSELDLHSIFYQLQEIHKLKQILLRKSQIILFNFSPKPIITLKTNYITPSRLIMEREDGKKNSFIKNLDNQLTSELFGKLQRAYKEIAEDMNKNPSNLCQLNINLKLAKLIGQDLQKLFIQPIQRKNGFLEENNEDNIEQP